MSIWSNSEQSPASNGVVIGLLIMLCVAFLVPGLIGHDPWKQDETYVFDIIHHILKSGDWVVPTLAGEPFMEKPPLYYLTAAGFAHVFSPMLPEHDAARLASGMFMALTLLFIGLTGRELWGRGYGRRAVLILIGCVGLTRVAHEMINDVPLLAGFSMAFYGLALSRRDTVRAGLLIGTGVGIGFLSKGLLAPGMIGITAVLLPAVSASWHRRAYAECLMVAMVAALPWLLIWPLALYERSPELFMNWLWLNNLGRFAGFARLGAEKTETGYYLQTLPWQAWPTLPLALFALWRVGRAGFKTCAVQLTVLAVLVILAVLNAAAVARDIYALPILVPLSVLAARALDDLPARVVTALSWVNMLLFGTLAAVVWLVWTFMIRTGAPPQIAALSPYLPLDFQPHFAALPFVAALVLTVLWLIAMVRIHHSSLCIITTWSLGVVLVWGQLSTIMLPWLDYAKSYRSMTVSLRNALPLKHDCIASIGLGESQRGMLDYMDDLDTRRFETNLGADNCELLLVENNGKTPDTDPGPGWQEIWQGTRPGDTKERHRLYERTTALARSIRS